MINYQKRKKRIKPKVDTDKVLVTIKKTLYDFRDIDFDVMTEPEKENFRENLATSKDIALSILSKIKDK
ncbi:MAG: hypothetical protein AB8G86_29670 [Saprospiraceae bacterium]